MNNIFALSRLGVPRNSLSTILPIVLTYLIVIKTLEFTDLEAKPIFQIQHIKLKTQIIFKVCILCMELDRNYKGQLLYRVGLIVKSVKLSHLVSKK